MAKSKKNQARRAVKTGQEVVPPVNDGRQPFTVFIDGSEHVILASDEEDAAERLLTRRALELEVVTVRRDLDGRLFLVRGSLLGDEDWSATSSEEILAPPKRPAWPAAPVPDLQCSFCGKAQREVKKLIAGPTVYICDECLVLSNEICLVDGVDVVQPAKTTVDSDKKQDEAEEKAKAEAAARVAKAEALLEAVREGKTAVAKLRMIELAKLSGDEVFQKEHIISLLHLAEDAHRANVSIPSYIDLLKARIAIYERATKGSTRDLLDSWVLASMGLGSGLAYAAALAGAAKK